jgi:hypothetical protein
MVKKKEKDYPAELIKKAARLLKNETLTKEQKKAYSLHGRKLNRIRRLKYIVNSRNEQWSIDLADLNELSGYNNQYRYILVCVDIYTRYVFVNSFSSAAEITRAIPTWYFAGSYLRFSACYVDENNTIRFSEKFPIDTYNKMSTL